MARQKSQSKPPADSSQPRRSAPPYAFAAVLVALGSAAYFNSFAGEFIIDDQLSITQNHAIRSLWPPGRFFSSSRPLVDFTLALNYAIGGLERWGYHLFNLLTHLLAGLILFGLIRRTPLAAWDSRTMDWLAFWSTLLWLVHPLNTQAVTYVIQRSESMMGLCYILTLYCVNRSATSESPRRWYVGAIVACALGMGSKAVMLTAPIVALIYDRTFLTGSFIASLRSRGWMHIGLGATWLLLALFGIVQGVFAREAVDPITVGFGFAGVSPWEYFRTQPEIILHYLRLAFVPVGQCVDYGWPVQNNPAIWLSAGAAVLLLLCLSCYGLYRRWASGFTGVTFFLILGPTSSFIPIRDLAFEHRMYLPLACVLVLAVFGAARFCERVLPRLALGAIATAASLGLLLATIARNSLYSQPVTLWRDTIRKADPRHARPHNALGNALLNERLPDEAIAEFNRALELDPYYAGSYASLGNALLFKGDYAGAVEKYRRALTISPFEFTEDIHFLYGSALLAIHQYEEAATAMRVAIELRPDYPEAWCNLGNALRSLGKFPDAEGALRKSLSLKPGYPEAFANLGMVYIDTGQSEAAMEAFRNALAHSVSARAPTGLAVQCHLKIAEILRSQRRYDEARKHLESILQIDPRNPAAQAALRTLAQPG